MKIFSLFGEVLLKDEAAQKGLDGIDKKGKGISKRLGTLAKSAGKVGAGIAAGAGVAIGGMIALGIKVGNAADEILDLNSITGMSTDEIQAWRKAAEVAGVAPDAMANASAKLTKSLDTMSEGTNKGNEALQTLGLSLEDIENMSADERMNTLTEALAGVDDKTERAQLGADLFGGTWKEIAPIVDLGSEAMNKAKDSANIISEEDLKKANDFRISVADMKEQVSFFVTEIGIALLPMLQGMFDWIQGNMPVIKETSEKVFTAIKSVMTTVWDFLSLYVIPIFTNMFDNVQGNMPVIKATFETVFNAIWEVAKTVWEFFKDNVIPIYAELYEWIQGHMPTIKETISTVFEKIKEVALMVWNFFNDNILPILASLYEYIQDKMPQIQSIIETVFGIIADVVNIVWDLFENFLLPILNALWDFISPTFPLISAAVKLAFDIIFEAVDLVVGIFEGLVDIVESAVGWLSSWNNKEVEDKNTTVHTNYTSSGGGGGMVGGIPKLARGGNILDDGAVMVGEQGPEILSNMGGARVTPLDKLGESQTANIYIELDGRTLAKAIGQPLTELIRVKTGLRI